MPLPYSNLYKGLATGLHTTLSRNEFLIAMAYMRGADTRVKILQSGRYDFVITSKLAAESIIKNYDNIEIALELGEKTYVNKHVLVFSNEEKLRIKDGIKVGIDRTSIDQYLLTIKEFEGINVEFVDIPYNQIVSKIINKEIDVAVWSIDEIEEKEIQLNYRELQSDISKNADIAVVIVNKKNKGIKEFIEKFLDKQKVREIQHEVIIGKIAPKY